MANQRLDKAINLGSSGIGSSGRPAELLSNLGSLEQEFATFNKSGKIATSTLWNVIDNLGMFNQKLPSTLKSMAGLNSETATYGDLLGKLKISWDSSGKAQFSLPGVDAKAITGDIEESIKALVQGQVKFWGAMVKFYEGLDQLANSEDDAGLFHFQYDGIDY